MHKGVQLGKGRKHIGRGSYFKQNWDRAAETLFQDLNWSLSKSLTLSSVWRLLSAMSNLSGISGSPNFFLFDMPAEPVLKELPDYEEVVMPEPNELLEPKSTGSAVKTWCPQAMQVNPMTAPASHLLAGSQDVDDVKALVSQVSSFVAGKSVSLYSAGKVSCCQFRSHLLLDVERLDLKLSHADHTGCHPHVQRAVALKLIDDLELLHTIRVYVRISDEPCIVFRCNQGQRCSVACVMLLAHCLRLSGDVSNVKMEHLSFEKWQRLHQSRVDDQCKTCHEPQPELFLLTRRLLAAYLSVIPDS